MERSGKNAKCFKEKLKRYYSCCNQKLASTPTNGSAFLKRVPKVENSKYEHDLLQLTDCFIDGYGFVNSDHVNFSINSY